MKSIIGPVVILASVGRGLHQVRTVTVSSRHRQGTLDIVTAGAVSKEKSLSCKTIGDECDVKNQILHRPGERPMTAPGVLAMTLPLALRGPGLVAGLRMGEQV